MASHLKPQAHTTSNTSSVSEKLLDTVVGRFQWPEGAVLYYLTPERELLPDKTRRLMFQAYLKYSGLSYSTSTATNADYMSPSGQSPFLIVQFGSKQMIFSDFFKMVSFLESQKLGVGLDLDKKEKAQHEAYLSLIRISILPAIDYYTWISKSSRQATLSSYSYGLPWPLRHIIPYIHYVKYTWNHWNMYKEDETYIYNKFEEACRSLSILLGTSQTFYSSGSTALDALVSGFTEAILSSESPLKDILNKYGNLIDFCHSSGLLQRKGLQFISSPSSVRLAGTV